jgi:hypothetical protein
MSASVNKRITEGARSHSSSRLGFVGSCSSRESRSDSSDAEMRFIFFSSLRSYCRSLGSDARALRAYCWTKRLSSPANRVFMRCVAMYQSGDNPSHALISLSPIVDDSRAEVEWLFMGRLSPFGEPRFCAIKIRLRARCRRAVLTEAPRQGPQSSLLSSVERYWRLG